MFRRLVFTALAIAAAGLWTSAQAQGSGEWVRLGAREVDVTKTTDAIDVSGVRGSFNALRLQVPRGDIALNDVEVRYAGTAVHRENRRINLLEGERTRPINPGAERFVDIVTLSIEPARNAAKRVALVEVWGRQTAAGARAVRPTSNAPVSGVIPAAPTSPTAPAAKPGQEVIAGTGEVLFGAQRVGFGVDRDVIPVGAEIGQFDKVRFRVLENDIFVNDMTVVYANGEKDTLAVNAEIKKETRTKWFTLKGDRFIKEIQFTYRSRPNFRGQARIEATGEYSEGWLGPKGRGRQFNQGWVLLGAQTAGFLGFDNDLIPVGRNEGGFRQLRVNVKDRAITLDEIRVIYANGQDDVIKVNRQKVEAGSTYGPIDLKGGVRAIKEIRAKYRSRFIDRTAVGRGAAIVEIWGQH